VQKSSWIKVAAVGAAATVVLAGCSSGSSKSTGTSKSAAVGGLNTGGATSGSTGGGPKTYDIGFEGPLSGTNAQLGINEENGVQLAVTQANADSSLGFTIKLTKSDDQGDPAKGPAAAAQLQQDTGMLGVIGPSFSGSTKAVGDSYQQAGLTFITPSATNAQLGVGKFAWKVYHRIVPNDNVEGTQGADWLARKGLKKVYVMNDLSDYGSGVATAVQTELKAKGVAVVTAGVDAKTTDYGPAASAVVASKADAIFYGGYDAQAALLAKALVSAGYKGITVTGNGGKSSVFTQNSGTAGNGWYFTCGCQDATVAPAAKAFTAAYTAAFKTPPSTYSPEAYDATNALIQAIKAAAGAGTPTRASVLAAVNALDYKGITTEIKFEASGEVDASVATVNLYQQEKGVIGFLGDIKTAK
jgi:branched-chain amino acid transport system substrate-binding protein